MDFQSLFLGAGAFSKIVLFSAFAGWFITFGSKTFSLKLGIVAKRDGRRRHRMDTPLMGGLAFYLVLSAVALMQIFSSELQMSSEVGVRSAFCFLIAITLIFGVGLIDDWIELKALPKFSAQITAAALVILSEPSLPPILQRLDIPYWVGVPIALFCIVGITNAMNMIDGLDGLTTGLSVIFAMSLVGIMMAAKPQPTLMVFILLALSGCGVGFLFHNFYPATIFLGDSGSLLLGFIIATGAMRLDIPHSFVVATSIPILLLSLPIADVFFSIMRRLRLQRSVFQGDRSHIHHRLQQVGLSHRSVVLLIWLCGAYLGGASFFLTKVSSGNLMYIFASVIPTVCFWFIALYFIEHRLSYQAAKYSHLFLKQEDLKLRDRRRLSKYFSVQVENYAEYEIPFAVISIDCRDFIKELANERPYKMVAFYMNIYEILKTRLRETDLIARVSDNHFIAILAGAGEHDGSELSVMAQLSTQVKILQESYHVFQSHPHRPEGFRVYQYPKDAQRIWQLLDFSSPEAVSLSEKSFQSSYRKVS